MNRSVAVLLLRISEGKNIEPSDNIKKVLKDKFCQKCSKQVPTFEDKGYLCLECIR